MSSELHADRKWLFTVLRFEWSVRVQLSKSQSYELKMSIKSLYLYIFHSRRRVSATCRTRFSQPMSSAKLVGRRRRGLQTLLGIKLYKEICSVHKMSKEMSLKWGCGEEKGTTKPAAEERPLHTFTYFCEVAWRRLGSSGGRQRWRSLKCGELSHNDCRQDT